MHHPDSDGGSGYSVNPGVALEYFPAPAAGRLRDLQFLAWDPPSVPGCVTSDCVATSPADEFAYLEAAQTIDPYCQSYFGPSYHPMLQPWEYHGGGRDPESGLSPDSNVWDLNAGVLGKTLIYGCVSYTTDPLPPRPTRTRSP